MLIGCLLATTPIFSCARAETGSVVQTHAARFDRTVEHLHAMDLGRSARAQRVRQAYGRAFATDLTRAVLGSGSEHDLHLLFDAASTASFENPEGAAYRDALAALRRLGSRASDREIGTAQGMLFQARQWRALDEFRRRYADHPGVAFRRVTVEGHAGEHAVIDAHGSDLAIRSVEIAPGPKIVVVSHPLCPFTQRAVQAIDANPRLKEVIRKHSTWIAPPDRNMDLTPFAGWKGRHPEAPISIAYGYSAWPELDEWGTPTFYFFKDGKLVDTVVGWPRGGRMDALKAGLAKIGLEAE